MRKKWSLIILSISLLLGFNVQTTMAAEDTQRQEIVDFALQFEGNP